MEERWSLRSPEIKSQTAAALVIAHANGMGKYVFFRGEIEKYLIDTWKYLIDTWKSESKCVALKLMKRRLISDYIESHTVPFKQHSVTIVFLWVFFYGNQHLHNKHKNKSHLAS